MNLLALSGSIDLLTGAFDLKVPQLPLSFQGSLQYSCDIHIPRSILRLEKPFQVVQFASLVIYSLKDKTE